MPLAGSLRTVGAPVHIFFRSRRVKSELRLRKSIKNEDHGGPYSCMWSFPSMVNMGAVVGIGLVFFDHFFPEFLLVTPPAPLVPPAPKSEKKN